MCCDHVKYYSLVLVLLIGCNAKVTVKDSYPGTMRLLSMYDGVAEIEDCDGLGFTCPSGLIKKCQAGSEYPATYDFHRLKQLPQQFTIRWKTSCSLSQISPDPPDVQYHSQVVYFPKNLKGKKGEILFLLDENNQWSCSLRDENDWTKVIETE
jgi:hypothetical protein